MQAVQPRPFGRRRVPPPSVFAPAPENTVPAWTGSQFNQQRGIAAAQSVRPLAGTVAWLHSLANAGITLSERLLADVITVGTSAFACLLIRLRSIQRPSFKFPARRFRRQRPVAPSNPLLDEMASSWRGVFVRTLAYIGGIAALSVIAAELFQPAPVVAAAEPAPRSEWMTVARPYPAFHLSLPDAADEQRYAIERHSEGGGRKDILSWGQPGESPRSFMVEIYRPGSELDGGFAPPTIEIGLRAEQLTAAMRMHESLPINTKFGPMATVDFNIGRRGGGHCVGFVRTFDEPRLQIAGLSCNNDALVDRFAMACALDRLTLMSAGSDPDIAKLFAQAELKRNFCGQRDPILYATPRRSMEPVKPVASSLRGRMVR